MVVVLFCCDGGSVLLRWWFCSVEVVVLFCCGRGFVIVLVVMYLLHRGWMFHDLYIRCNNILIIS